MSLEQLNSNGATVYKVKIKPSTCTKCSNETQACTKDFLLVLFVDRVVVAVYVCVRYVLKECPGSRNI